MAEPKSFLDRVASTWTLLPSVGGLSVLIVAWALEPGDSIMTYCYAAAGGGVGLGVLSVLVQTLFGGGGGGGAADPIRARLREQILEALKATEFGPQRGQVEEARAAGTPAGVERG
jgi:hypothetical protein